MNRINTSFYYIVILILVFGINANINAQVGSVANIMSNFGLFTGNLSTNVNPALQYTDSSKIIISLPSVFAQLSNNSLSINDINYYFGNDNSRYLTNIDKQNLLSSFSNDGKIFTKVNFSLFKIYYSLGNRYGTLGIEVNDNIAGNVSIPNQLIELGLVGNQINRTYTFNDLNAKSWWLRAYSLTYANRILQRENNSGSVFEAIDIGVKLKVIKGFAYAGTESVSSYFYTSQVDNSLIGNYSIIANTAFSENLGIDYDFDSTYSPKGNFNIFPKSVGSGFGVDIGMNFIFRNKINLSIALNDMGSVTWDKHAAQHNIYGSFFVNDIFDEEQLDSLEEMSHSDSKYISEFSTTLPLNLQIGAMVDISKYIEPLKYFSIFVNYSQGFNNAPGNSTKPIMEAGTFVDFGDYLPNAMFAIRYDETQSMRIPFMFGYSFPCFAASFYGLDVISLFNANTSKANISFGLNMVFKIL